MRLTSSVRFVLTDQDRSLLEAIANRDGERNMSLTIRRLIRKEAQQCGIETVSQDNQPQAVG